MVPEEPFDFNSCLEKVREQDQAAARQLVDHLYPIIIPIVRRHLPRRVQEEDLMQDIFIKMFNRLDQYNGKVPFPHWVSRVAVTTCIDRLRFEQSRPESRWADLSENEASLLDATLHDTTSQNDTEVSATREMVDRLLMTLPVKERLIIQLLDLDGLSVAEISEKTGLSKPLIKIRAFRARRRLRKQINNLTKKRL